MDLVQSIDQKIKKVQTTSLDVSFNELADMFRSKELNITPEYQRLFRWSEGTQSRFIESLLLEMPVPPIFVVEVEDGRYELIDGLQRISSYLHMRGELEIAEGDDVPNPVRVGEKLVLTECDIVDSLNGQTFETLPASLQIRLKRAFVRMEVVRKGSDPLFKYHMFKRLNTGGEKLTDQQIRNCTIRMLDPRFNEYTIELSKLPAFKSTLILTDEDIYGAFDVELVLRFFALKNDRARFKHDVGDFLTDYMEGVTRGILSFNYDAEKEAFDKTFSVLNNSLGELAFGLPSTRKQNELTRGFSVYHYEAITMGIQPYLGHYDPTDNASMAKLREDLRAIKVDPEFRRITTGGGKNSPGPLRARIEFVQRRLFESAS